MAVALPSSSKNPRKRSSWPKTLAIVVVGLLALLVILYFVATSSAFIKSVVLPRVGKAINGELTVHDVALSPFSQIILSKLALKTIGTEPLLIADDLRIRYKLFSILGGKIEVEEVSIVAPIVQIVQEADGTTNLDPLLQTGKQQPSKTANQKGSTHLDVHNVALKNATVRFTKKEKDGSSQTTELSNVDVTLDQLKNGEPGKLTLAAGLKLRRNYPPSAKRTNDVLEGKMNGTFGFAIDADLRPKSINGNARLDVARAEGAFQDLAGLGSTLQAEMTPTDIKQVTLHFERGGQGLGQLAISGPLDLAKTEGKLKLEIQSIDRQVLNLFGASRGWDFGNSKLDATNLVELGQNGSVIAATGKVSGNQIGIRQNNQSTPALDLDVNYQVSVNLNQKTAAVQTLSILGKQNQNELLRASLDRPMNLNWGSSAQGLPDSTFQLAIQQLNLRDWQAVLGTNLPTGKVGLQLNIRAEKDGKQLSTKLASHIQDLAVRFGTNGIDQVEAKFDLTGQIEDLKIVSLEKYQFELLQKGQPLAKSSGSARYDLSKNDIISQSASEVSLATVLQQFPLAGASASGGVIQLTSNFTQKNDKQTAVGTLSLIDFTGRYADYHFQSFQSTMDYGVDIAQQLIQVQRLNLTFRQGSDAGGNVELSGRYHLTNRSGQITFKLLDLNQNALRPVLAASLGQMKLVSASVNANGSASYDPNGESAVKADINLVNCVIDDPQQKIPRTPLSAQFKLDGSLRQQILDLRQFVVTLSPTQRAQNQFQAKGRLDINKTNATPSQISLQAESLDVTPYYDMFAGSGTTNAPAPQPSTAKNETEPAPVDLPFQQMTADLKVDRFYLRALVITNLQTTVKVNRGEVTVKPLQMSLNGAPVNASAVLNLAVPGYKYDISLVADKVPIELLANGFSTNSTGRLQGELIAQAQLKGSGVTGPSLQKSLTGQLSLSMTNLNLEIVGKKTKRLLDPIALVLRVPELTQTPLNWVNAKADIGQGKINVNQFGVMSQAFYAEGQGAIRIAEVLTNSPLDLPINLSLRRSLAERANLVPSDAPTNTAYVQLPTFAKLEGTLGDPRTEINKLVISGLLLRSAAGISQIGNKAGNILQGVGGILSGQKPPDISTNVLSRTNAIAAPKTNKPPKFSPLDLLELIPKKK